MMTCMHQKRRYPEGGEMAHGGRVNLRTHECQDERGHAGRRYAKGSRGTARRERGCWGVRLLVACLVVSAAGARTLERLPGPRRQARSSMARETLQGEESFPSQYFWGQEQGQPIGGRLHDCVGAADVPAP